MPTSATVAELRTHLRPAGDRAWAACVALGRDPSPEALEALAELARDEDWRYRRAAIEALAERAPDRSSEPLILSALGDASPFVVRTACGTAAAVGATSAHAAIVDLLRAAEAPTRRAAVCALAQLYEEGDFDALFGIARADPDESVRRAAAWTLRTVAVPSHWRPLFDAWVEDALPRHRVWACELVAAYGDEAALTRIEPLSRDGDGHVRKAARGALRGPANGP